MATTLSELSLVIRAKADQISSDIEKGIRKAQGRFVAQGKVIGVALAAGVAASAGAIAAAFKRGVDQVDALAAAAQKVGMSTSGLAKLQLAAKLTDSSFEGLTQGIAKMQANLAKAAGGGDPKLVAGLEILKLDVQELRALAPEQQFMKIAGALGAMSDKGAQLALGKQIFGKGFLEFANLAEAGSAKLQEMAHIADVLGLTVSEKMVNAIGEFDNATHIAMGAWDGFSRQLAGEIAPMMMGLSDLMVAQIEKWGGMNSIAKEVANTITFLVAEGLGVAEKFHLMGSALAFCYAKVNELIAAFNAWGTKGIAKVLTGIGEIASSMGTFLRGIEVSIKKMANDLAGMIRTVFQTLINTGTQAVQDMANTMRGGVSGVSGFFGGPSLDNISLTAPQLPTGAPFDEDSGASDALFQSGEGLQKQARALEAASAGLKELEAQDKATAAQIADAYKEPQWKKGFLDATEAAKAGMEETKKVAQQTETDLSSMYEKAGKARKAHIEKVSNDTQRALEEMQSANRALVTDMVTAWISGTGKMSDIIHQWAQQSLRRIVDVLLFGTGQKGGGGLMGSLGGGGANWGGAVAGIAGALFGGAGGGSTFAALGSSLGSTGVMPFAEGGQTSGNRPILVGERGPEIFMPKGGGNVIPNGAMGGGGTTLFAPVINNSFQVGVSRIELAGILDAVEERTTAGVVAAYERGGNVRRRLRT